MNQDKKDLYGLYWILKTRAPTMTAVDKLKFSCESWEELALRIANNYKALENELNRVKFELNQEELFHHEKE